MNQERHIDREKELVSDHYDIDPRAFQFFLDERMNYSSAYFPKGDESLNLAQEKKLNLIGDKLSLKEGDRLLDVGCGWGNALFYYGKNYNCQVTGLTIAENQARKIQNKIEKAELADRVTCLVKHFQEGDWEEASFDKLMFIGSIIHIEDRKGALELSHKLLEEEGRILISETYLPQQTDYKEDRASEYIRTEVFGYGNLLTAGQEIRLLEEAGFEVLEVENITDHYVLTLDKWIANVKANKEKIDNIVPGESKQLRTYLTLARRALKRRTSLQFQILAQK